MQDVPFTQFLRPDGRTRAVVISMPDEVADKARSIIANGLRFECEELMTGVVSLTISDNEKDLAQELCENGPEVPKLVEKLITEFELSKVVTHE